MANMYFLILLAPVVFGKGVLDVRESDGRIVGGVEVSIEDFPYQVTLERIGIDMCGGTVIAPNRVLTAAHCFHARYNDYVIRCGSDTPRIGGQVVKVVEGRVHPNYSSSTNDYDVAVLILEKDVEVTSRCAPVPLSQKVDGGNRTCWVSGWGTLGQNQPRPTKLHAVDVKEFTLNECQRDYVGYKITESMICFGDREESKDACQGDSGGPLVDKASNELVGVTSWGLGCGQKNLPGVYANVAHLHDWIVAQ